MLWSSLCESQKRVILFKMPYCISLRRTVKWFRARAYIPLPFSELVLFIRILGICLSCFVESTFHFIQTKEALTHAITELQDRQGWTTHVWVLTPSGFLSTGFIRDPFATLPVVCRPPWASPELSPPPPPMAIYTSLALQRQSVTLWLPSEQVSASAINCTDGQVTSTDAKQRPEKISSLWTVSVWSSC